MLLLPHRNESEILAPYMSPKEAFQAKHSSLDFSMNMYNSFLTQVENAMRRLNLAEQELPNNAMEHSVSVQIDFGQALTHISLPSLDSANTTSMYFNDDDELHYHCLSACIMTSDELQTSIETLTNCQRQAIAYIHEQYRSKTNLPLRLFITGGAGVCKSFLLKIVIAYLQLYTSVISGVSPVKCCAHTGTAARHISGQTVHSLLAIPVEKYLNYASLSSFHLQRLQHQFSGIHTIVIDEISMISDSMFRYISRRLSEISGKQLPFGGNNIILFGDFFQIRPVCGQYAFQNRLLWELFKPIFLRQNVRQNSNMTYVHLLNRARVGLLNNADIDLLKTRLLSTSSKKITCTFISHDLLLINTTKNAKHF